eukprot:scaffold17112_cov103-Skeletonema_dohrnii-CCMP3373.AAC.5
MVATVDGLKQADCYGVVKRQAAMASQSSGKMRQVVFAEFGPEGFPAVNVDRYLIKLEELWNTWG